MHKLLKESVKVYQQFQRQGPKYLDTFDNRPIVEATMEAVKTKQLQDYIRQEFRPMGEVSMLPIHMQPDHSFTIALFALTGGVSMPLHDHPNMFVLSHTMGGIGEYESWDVDASEEEEVLKFRNRRIESKILKATEHKRIQLKSGDNCFTTPNKGNLHRFINKSEKEMFLFLDVILPHYNEKDRVISFYEPVGKDKLEILANPKQYKRHPIQDIDVNEFLVQ